MGKSWKRHDYANNLENIDKAKVNSEYKKWLKKARTKGWKVPVNNALPESSWINYWQQCEDCERNPDSGRSVIPHRVGMPYTSYERLRGYMGDRATAGPLGPDDSEGEGNEHSR